MEENYLYHLASFVLPQDVLKYFSIVKIEHSSSLLRIHLDEKMEKEQWSVTTLSSYSSRCRQDVKNPYITLNKTPIKSKLTTFRESISYNIV